MYVLGITGGTGAGKTTVLSVLERYGVYGIDCDVLYHQLLFSDNALNQELRARFPEAYNAERIDRKRLGKIVFGSNNALDDLNRITHRYILRAVQMQLEREQSNGRKIAAIDAIALLESGLARLCDITIFVKASLELRQDRIVKRDSVTVEDALARMKAQQKDDYFEKNCDITLVNDSNSALEFEKKCTVFFERLLGGIDDERVKR